MAPQSTDLGMHTPGPWTVEPFDGSDKEITIVEPAVWVDYDDVNHEEQAANARLIAAAPDLLWICADLARQTELLCECGEPECRTTRLRAVLAKVKGVS